MPHEIIGTEDLAQLRVVYPNDQRQFDWWAFDDGFCANLLTYAFANPARKGTTLRWEWQRAIQVYWREGKSRRDLATELSLSFDAIKSHISTIRKTAREFIVGGQAVRESAGLEQPAKHQRVRTIEKLEIDKLAEGDEDTKVYVEECRRLAVSNVLSLFNPTISKQLLELQRKHDEAADETVRQQCITEAWLIKNSVAKDDPYGEGRPFTFQADRRTKTKFSPRGRPRKEKPAVPQIKRKRGRPKKVYTPTITDAPVASGLFLLP